MKRFLVPLDFIILLIPLDEESSLGMAILEPMDKKVFLRDI
jgi:hypothetical protein